MRGLQRPRGRRRVLRIEARHVEAERPGPTMPTPNISAQSRFTVARANCGSESGCGRIPVADASPDRDAHP